MPPRIILWDVMDTLVEDPFRDVMPAFFGMTLREMLEQKHPTAWGRFERGELAEAEFLAAFFADGRSYDWRGFTAAIRSSYRWMRGIEALLAALADAGTEMHALSNYPEWYRWIEERLGVSRYVAWSFVSCRTRLRKPDAAAYRNAIDALGCGPAECVFIDDRATNCAAARQLGITSIEYRGDSSALREELLSLGFKA